MKSEDMVIVSPKALAKVWKIVREKLRTEDLVRFARTEKDIYAKLAQEELDRRETGGQV